MKNVLDYNNSMNIYLFQKYRYYKCKIDLKLIVNQNLGGQAPRLPSMVHKALLHLIIKIIFLIDQCDI